MTKLKNIKLLESYKTLTKPTTRSVIDRIIGLYKQNKINIATAEKLAHQTIGRGKAPQSALKRIEGYEGKNKKQATKTYFVTGQAKIKRTYFTRKSQKTNNPVKSKQTYHDEQRLTVTVEASSPEEAKKQARGAFKREIENQYYEKEEEFEDVAITSVIEEGQHGAKPPEHRLMKSAKPIKFDFIPSDESLLENEGFCVVDQFVGIYGRHVKKATRNWFINRLYEMNRASKLDTGVADVWSLEAGVSASVLCDIC